MLSMLFGSVMENGTEMTWLVVIKNVLLEHPVLNILIPLATQASSHNLFLSAMMEFYLSGTCWIDTLKSFDSCTDISRICLLLSVLLKKWHDQADAQQGQCTPVSALYI